MVTLSLCVSEEANEAIAIKVNEAIAIKLACRSVQLLKKN